MPKKKYKIMLGNLEVTSSDINDFKEILNLLSIAAAYERNLGHLKECETYIKKGDKIFKEIGEQI